METTECQAYEELVQVPLGGSVGYMTAFSSGHDPRGLGSSPALGSLLIEESASPFLSPSACACSVSLSNR